MNYWKLISIIVDDFKISASDSEAGREKAVSNFSLTLPAPQNDLAQAITSHLVFQPISYQSLFRSISREACQRLMKLKRNYQYSA